MKTMEERLRALEAANRLYKRGFFVLLASCAFLFMAFRAGTVPEVIQAKKFEVLDEQGKVLVRIGQDDGHGFIKTYNEEGNKLVNITYTTTNQGFIALEDGKGYENLRLSSSGDAGGGYMSMSSADHTRTVALYNDVNGGYLALNNNSGNLKVLLKAHSEGCGYLGLLNSSGNTILSMLQTSSGNGDFYLRNAGGKDRARISVSGSGGNLQLFNSNENKAVECGVTDSYNGVFNTFNSAGTYLQGIGGN